MTTYRLLADLATGQGAVPRGLDAAAVLDAARRNKLAYAVALGLDARAARGEVALDAAARACVDAALAAGRANAEKFRRGYALAERVLGARDVLLIKTVKAVPYSSGDIDLLVPSLDDAVRRFREAGHEAHVEEAHKASVYGDDHLEVSLHGRVAWGDVTVVDEAALWAGARDATMHGVPVRVPPAGGELAIMLAHLPFEQLAVNVPDFLTIMTHAREADLAAVEAQARRHRWGRTLRRTAAWLDGLHRRVEAAPSPLAPLGAGTPPAEAVFPARCSFLAVARAHVEKRAWSKVKQVRYFFRIAREVRA